MTQVRKYLCLISGALLSLAPSLTVAAEAKRLNCEATINGFKHGLTIEIENKKIASFQYISSTPKGNNCGLAAKRKEVVKKNDKSEWHDTNDQTLVDMTALGKHLGKVAIEKKDNTYDLHILEQAVSACGIGGYIVAHVRIRPDKNACEFPTGPVTPPVK